MIERRAEAGFTLIETVVSTAAIAIVVTAAVGMFAAIARNAEPDRVRDLATMVARNQLTYARALGAYAPASATNVDRATLAGITQTRTWGLATGPHTFTVTEPLVVPNAACGGPAGSVTVALGVTTDYEEPAGAPTFRVTVAYPPDPCRAAVTATIVLEEQLGAVAFVPGTIVTQDVTNPPWGQ